MTTDTNLVLIHDDRIVLLPGASLESRNMPHRLAEARWKFVAGPKAKILFRTKDTPSGSIPTLEVGQRIEFSGTKKALIGIANSGNEEAIFLRHMRQPSGEFLGELFMTMLTHLGKSLLWLLIAAARIIAGVLCLLIAAVGVKIIWETGSLLVASKTYAKILSDASAAATFVGVLITGFFGFSGIILTNSLGARQARKQSAESDKKSRELQETIAKELDKRIDTFARAFERYHSETLLAITEEKSKEGG